MNKSVGLHRRCLIACIGILMVSDALAQAPEVSPSLNHSQQGEAILLPFKQNLMSALQKGLAQGPIAAVDACKLEAPEIAHSLSMNGVQIGRTSHKLRNPENQGPDWVDSILARYVADPQSRVPIVVELENGEIGYAEPILTQPLCLVCHGTEIPVDLQSRISALYPEDQATGFQSGELRGLFWTTFPSE